MANNRAFAALSLDDFKKYWKEGQLADWERLALTELESYFGGHGALAA